MIEGSKLEHLEQALVSDNLALKSSHHHSSLNLYFLNQQNGCSTIYLRVTEMTHSHSLTQCIITKLPYGLGPNAGVKRERNRQGLHLHGLYVFLRFEWKKRVKEKYVKAMRKNEISYRDGK